MSDRIFRYRFAPDVPIDEVEATLVAAIMTTESLHGEVQVRLDVAHAFDPDQRSCVIDATTTVGQDLNRLFLGYVLREFGADSLSVEHVHAPATATKEEIDD